MAAAGLFLQSRGDVNHLAGYRVIHHRFRPDVSHHRLTRVQPDSQPQSLKIPDMFSSQLSEAPLQLKGAVERLLGIVGFGIAITRLNQAAELSSAAITAVEVTGVLFVVSILSGGIWSIEKEISMYVLRLHQV